MSVMTCAGCGTLVPAGKQFCTNCGTRVQGSTDPSITDPSGPTPVTQPQPTQQQATQPTPAYQQLQPFPTEPVIPVSRPAASHWRIVAIAAVAAVVVGAVAAFMWPASAGELVADSSVGPAGGTVPFSDGGKLEIPDGAVKQNQRFTVRKTANREPARIGGMLYPAGSLPVYLFTPLTINFGRAITLILPLPSGAVAGRIYVISDGRLTLIAVRPNEDGSVRISVIGFNGGRLVVRT